MKVEIGSYIKVFCTNGLVEGGKVVEYTSEQLVLKLIDESYTIIQNPGKNVVAIKLSSQDDSVFVDVETKPDRYYRREDLRAKNLAELQKLKAHEERKRAAELFRSHKIKPASSEVIFGTPNYSKPISQHPKKKA